MNRTTQSPDVRIRLARRGFTLMELLIAITAGLFVSIAAIALARQGTRFFQQESRIANTQFSATLGFDRLRTDIARAGFMSSPNIQRDPFRCGAIDATWPAGMKAIAAVRVEHDSGRASTDTSQQANNLAPDMITLAGSYSSFEWFPVYKVISNGNGTTYDVYLQIASGAVARSGGNAALGGIFQAGRMLRIVDDSGRHEYGAIESFAMSAAQEPVITLAANPPIALMRGGSATCGIVGNGTGILVNVVNLVRYYLFDVRNHQGNYAPLYASTATAPGDESRLELVRVELDATGAERAGTLEIVSEYAVDLRFGVSVVTGYGATGVDPAIVQRDIGDAQTYVAAADVSLNPTIPGAERIRSVRARLAVRSREGDRQSNLAADGGAIFRYAMPDGVSFARVRTLTADILLPNLTGVAW